MAVKFVVFVDIPNTMEQAHQISTFNRLGYTTLVDSIHGKNYTWLYRNSENGRFFIQEKEELYMFSREDLKKEMLLVPDFAVIFPDDKTLEDYEWSRIYKYLEAHLTDAMEDVENTEKVQQLLEKPVVATAVAENTLNEPQISKESDFYNLDTRYLENEDIMLYEVTKPFTDLPYTSVTFNYSAKGHKPFFTDLFIAPSWGVAQNDIQFLKHVWEKFNMEGEFNLDKMLKEATENCVPGECHVPAPEPVVYRRTILDVIDILAIKKERSKKVIPDFIKNKPSLV